jgi:hypothetical protein
MGFIRQDDLVSRLMPLTPTLFPVLADGHQGQREKTCYLAHIMFPPLPGTKERRERQERSRRFRKNALVSRY